MIKLIKNAQVHYPGNPLDKQYVDLLIIDGIIDRIDEKISLESADQVVKGDNLLLFPSLVDMQCTIGEPGDEDKEDFNSAAKAAVAGGFGDIVMLPNTNPVIDTKATFKGINSECKDLAVRIHSYGALSKNCEGFELSEMYDLSVAGVVGFSDGKNPIKDSNMMKRALEYAKGFNALVCSFPLDERINPGGMVNESLENLTLGLKPSPGLAEEIMLVRDLYLAEYTNSRLHFSTISTKKSISLIREAKLKDVNVTCGVAMANLIYTEKNLAGFDSIFKTNPPLRSESDRKALIEGLLDGVIDVIITDHSPEIIENKDREFDYASYGMTMLETTLSLINEHLPELHWDKMVDTLSLKPRSILGLTPPKLEAGEVFDFTLFDTEEVWAYKKEIRKTKASNSPLLNRELLGRVIPI
tara:strand:+ start:4343 stop:5581 length:1239 start_codon:yes stop_codon:yes gene_type:complete